MSERAMWMIQYDIGQADKDGESLALFMDDSHTRGWWWDEKQDEGFCNEEVASMALDGFEVRPPPGWEMGPFIDRVPNMYTPPRTVGQKHDQEIAGFAKPERTEAPRITLQEGDAVAWSTSGKGTVTEVYEGIGGQLVAEVEPLGWWWDETDSCFTLTETGKRGTLAIRAVDLRKGEG